MRPRAAEAACLNDEMDAKRSDRRPRSPLKFFLLVFSAPLWLIGAVIDVQWLPGLPLSALGAFCPLLAALILVHEERKTAGVVALLKRSFDFKRIGRRRGYVPIVLLMPGVSVLVYWLMRWMNMPVPAPQLSILRLAGLVVAFVAAVVVVVWPQP